MIPAFDWIIGDTPPWMELGPPEAFEGVILRKVLGDWSNRQECDRPPPYVAFCTERPLKTALPPLLEGREPVPQRCPGRNIADLKGIHSGKVAILFNGQSLRQHDLYRITLPTIGLNRTYVGHPDYVGPQPDYLCVVDELWLKNEGVRNHPGLVNGSANMEPLGYRAKRHFRASPFSFDIGLDGYVSPIPCTTGHLALQLAVHLGFTELYCLGFDMGGKHWDGSPGSKHYNVALIWHKKQAKVLEQTGIKVYICGSPDSKLIGTFAAAPFDAVCG